jgi:phosphopantothenoylcysteine synthetase/decarboxylase
MIVLNSATVAGTGFEVDTNEVNIFVKDGENIKVPLLSKFLIAHAILDAVKNNNA